MTRWIKFSKSI